MAFEILTKETRTARAITWFGGICRSITDFVPGSKIRSKFESVFVEMESQDLSFYQAAKKAIVSGVYMAFGFPPLPAITATGIVTFSTVLPASVDITIPTGTMVATSIADGSMEKIYLTTATAVLLTGTSSITAPVLCTKTGIQGNTPANTITVLKSAVAGIASVTNVGSIKSGQDVETADARQARFQKYIPTLRRGTEEAVIYGATTAKVVDIGGAITEMVQSAVIGPGDATGHIICYVYNGTGSTSSTLQGIAKKIIDGDSTTTPKIPGFKAAGVVVDVASVGEIFQDVVVDVWARAGFDKAAVKLAVTTAINLYYMVGLGIGDDVIINDLRERIQAVDGVYDHNITNFSSNVAVAYNQIVIPNTTPPTVNML